MRKELPKVYDPRDVEPRIYDMWMQGGCFKAEPNPEKKPFSIVMPPPNVTGQLHMGHAMDATLQDILETPKCTDIWTLENILGRKYEHLYCISGASLVTRW